MTISVTIDLGCAFEASASARHGFNLPGNEA